MTAKEIIEYLPGLSDVQKEQIEAMGPLYTRLNALVNVVSRKDIDNLYPHHVLHSLVLGMFLGDLVSGTSMLDIGTGGGFPGIPLAVRYPECQFHLIDRKGKKIRVAQEVAEKIGLHNVTFQHGDIKECKGKYDYVVSRAVMPLNDLVKLIRKNVLPANLSPKGNKYANGLVCLKGGDISEECKGINEPIITCPVSDFVDIPHFRDKMIVYVPIKGKDRQ